MISPHNHRFTVYFSIFFSIDITSLYYKPKLFLLFYIQADFAEGETVAGKDDAGDRIQQAADALDFGDEDELIEEASAPAPASYAAVGAALATGRAAEDEDYDFDEEEAPAAAQQQQQPPPLPAIPQALVSKEAPAPPSQQPQQPPPPPRPVIIGDPTTQANIARARGIQLPTLSKDQQGDAVLAFTDLFRSVSKQSSAQQQRERRVRFSDASITQLTPSHLPDGSTEVDRALLLLKSGSEKLVEMGVDLILQKEAFPAQIRREGEDIDVENQMRSSLQDQEGEHMVPGALEGVIEEGRDHAAAAAAVGTDAAEKALPKQKQQLQRTRTTTTTSTTTGLSFAVLPPCVFDPVIQQIWELKMNNNSLNGSVVDRGVNDTSSEHETDEEMDVDGNGGEQQCVEKSVAMEEEGEEDPEDEELARAKKIAAESKAAREHITAWTTGTGSDSSAPDLEDVVNVLHTAPLLRYSNPLKSLFPTTATVAAPAPPAAAAPAPSAAAGGEEAGTSAAVAAAGPSTSQQPALAAPQHPETTAQPPAATAPTAPAEDVEALEEDVPALPILAASRAPTWESDIILEGGSAAADRLQSLPLTLDLNDPSLVLHDVSKKAERNKSKFIELVNTSTATVVPYQKRAAITAKGVDSTNEAILELAKINISRDGDYFGQSKRRAGSGGVRAVHHAKPAAELITIPLSLELKELMLYHRPRGFWWPLDPAKGTRNPHYPPHSTVIIETLTGASKLSRGVDLSQTTPAQMWEYIKPGWKLKKDEKYPLPLFLVPGAPRPTIVSADRPLNQSGIPMRGKETMEIVTAYREVELKPTSLVGVPDESDAALRTENAFKLASDLRAATPGKVVLVEYMQDAPLLLNRPGMGARLATYYRKKNATDTGSKVIRDAATQAGERWRVGAMNPLNEDDESPFLGEIEPGSAQLSVETGLFTAPAAPHAALDSDFLLTRGPSGYMSIREITGSVASGQQLPLHRIPVPGSRDLKDLEERLIYVYVFRILKERKLKEERKMKKKEAVPPQVPTVSLKELCVLFPSRPQTALRLVVKDMCGLILCYKDRTGDEFYRLAEGARMPASEELKKKFTPEDACVLESSRVAEYRMQQSGLLKAVKFNYGNVAADKLRLAAEMLPPEEVTQAAAKAVESQYITAAWNLTDAFMSSFREGRATMRLLGPGDPTGRGVGYSFVRDVRHKGTGSDDPTKAMNKQRSGKVQGTDADLRRMTTEQAKKKLIDFGLDAAEIDPLGRWVRIDLVRQLANASAADGSVAGIAKYVRHQKTTLIELQKRYRERAQEIFNRQLSVLNDSASEELGDQAALEAEIEAELAAEEREDEGGETSPAKKKKSGGGRDSSPAPEDEARQLEEMRAAGLLGSSPAATAAKTGADGAGPSTSAAAAAGPSAADTTGVSGPLIPGQTRRIRREVLARGRDGSFQKIHEVIYAGRDRPFLLASLYQKEGQVITGPWGFGDRVINAARAQQRLSYNAARGRGVGRGRGRGGGGGRGSGGGPGSRGGKGSRGRGRGSRGGRGRGSPDDFDFDDELDYQIEHVGPRNARRARATKKKEEIFLSDEDFEDIDSEFEEDDEEFDAYAEQMAQDGIILVKEKKKIAAPRPPRQPKPVELDAEGNPIPKKTKPPRQPKKEKAPLTEEQLDKQRQRQQQEAAPQFYSGTEIDAYLREEGVLEEDDGPTEVLTTRVNRVRGAGIVGSTTAVEPVYDTGPVEWDPNAPLATAAPAPPTRAAAAAAQHWTVAVADDDGDEEWNAEDEDEDDEEYLGEGTGKRKRSGAAGGGGRSTRAARTSKFVAPAPQPTRASARGKKKSKYEDVTTDEEEYEEEYDPRASPKRGGGGGGGFGGGARKKAKTSGSGYQNVYAAAPPPGGGGATGSKALGAVFARIIDQMKKEGDAYRKSSKIPGALTWYHTFEYQVPASINDYKTLVPENKWMWLKKIITKAKKGEYYDVEAVMTDLRQIRDNARVYNDPVTGGKYKYPDSAFFIKLGEDMVKYVEEKLELPENKHAIEMALDQINAAAAVGDGGGYYDDGGAVASAVPQGGIEDFVVAFDPSANYSLEALAPAVPTAAPVAKVEWVLCETCKAWRILEPGIDPNGYFECRMKNGFSCETPLEPGGEYEQGEG
jgi:hypothetical protein